MRATGEHTAVVPIPAAACGSGFRGRGIREGEEEEPPPPWPPPSARSGPWTPPPPSTSPTPMDGRSHCRGRRHRLAPMDAARVLQHGVAPLPLIFTSTGTFLTLDLASS
jgi:hypothetical protein